MATIEEIENVRDRFAAGEIHVDELLLHVEPLLGESPLPTRDAKVAVDAIERLIHTTDEPQRTALIVDVLDAAISRLQPRPPGLS